MFKITLKTPYDTASSTQWDMALSSDVLGMSSLNGTALRVVTRLNNTYIYDVHVEMRENHKYELVGGYAVAVLRELSNLLDFNIELVTDPPNLAYNFPLAQNYSVDLFADSYSIRMDRRLLADPTFVTGISRVRVFFNRALQSSMHDVVTGPFTPSFWQLLAFFVVLLSVVYCVIAYYVERDRYTNSLFQIISIFLMRDAKLHVRSMSLRMILFTASITVFLVMSAYSAKIFAIGAIKVDSIGTLAQLVKSNFDISYDIGYGNGSILEGYVKTWPNSSVIPEVDVKAENSKFRFDTFESAMEEVKSRPFAYIIDEETAYYATKLAFGKVPCELGLTSISFAGLQYQWAMFTGRGFEHKAAINNEILRLGETGILRKLAQRWVPGKATDPSACSTGSFAEFTGVQLAQLQIAFSILVVAGFASCLILTLEIFKWKAAYIEHLH